MENKEFPFCRILIQDDVASCVIFNQLCVVLAVLGRVRALRRATPRRGAADVRTDRPDTTAHGQVPSTAHALHFC